jgi:hypothetical protein
MLDLMAGFYVGYDGWLSMLARRAYDVYAGYMAMLSMLYG